MEIWNNKTGELLCRQEPVYGGTGRIDLPKFDETGYILQPPCLWGDAPGLGPMPRASGVALTVRAITNSTFGHHGRRRGSNLRRPALATRCLGLFRALAHQSARVRALRLRRDGVPRDQPCPLEHDHRQGAAGQVVHEWIQDAVATA